MKREQFDKRKRKRKREWTVDRHGKTERKEKEKGKKRMGASGPLVHDEAP
jgi:hypothetical protein